MKPLTIFSLAVIIIIGIELLNLSFAIEGPEQFEFPFKLPFHGTIQEIHRTFPLEVKYIKEVLHDVGYGQSENKSKSTYDTRNKKENAPRDIEQGRIKDLPEIAMDSYDLIKQAIQDEKSPAVTPLKKHSVEKYSPFKRYHEDEEDADEEEDYEDEPGEDYSEKDAEFWKKEADNLEEEGYELVKESKKYLGKKFEKMNKYGDYKTSESITKYPYELSLVIKSPNNTIMNHTKKGFLCGWNVKDDDTFTVLKFLLDTENQKCLPVSKNDPHSKFTKNNREVHHPFQISSPTAGYSSQIMDLKGNVYRQERIIPLSLPLRVRNYRQHILDKKQDAKQKNNAEPVTPQNRLVENATDELVSTTETADVASNEVIPSRNQKAIALKSLKPKNVKGLLYPKPGLFHFESKNRYKKEFKKENPEEKTSSFYDDNDDVKRVVIIRPQVKVHRASVGLDGRSRKYELAVKQEVPVIYKWQAHDEATKSYVEVPVTDNIPVTDEIPVKDESSLNDDGQIKGEILGINESSVKVKVPAKNEDAIKDYGSAKDKIMLKGRVPVKAEKLSKDKVSVNKDAMPFYPFFLWRRLL